MQLLLVAEQSALLQRATSQYKRTLKPLQTEDGRVSITPVLTFNPIQDPFSYGHNISLSFGNQNAEPTLVHCKLVVSERSNTQTNDSKPPQHKEVETRVILQSGPPTVSSLLKLPSDHPFEKIIILFMVYDIAGAHPVSGLGANLNRARLERRRSCDVKLVVDGVELDVHRAVLAERSPVLNRMLTTGLFKEGREGRVEVVDFPCVAIEKFLEYLYTDRVEDLDGWDVALLQLADKYEVPELTDYCVLRLWTCSPPRALQVLNATGVSDIVSSQLRRRLTTIVVDNMPELGRTPEWAAFKKNHPALVDIMLGSAALSGESSCPMWSQYHPAAHTDASK